VEIAVGSLRSESIVTMFVDFEFDLEFELKVAKFIVSFVAMSCITAEPII